MSESKPALLTFNDENNTMTLGPGVFTLSRPITFGMLSDMQIIGVYARSLPIAEPKPEMSVAMGLTIVALSTPFTLAAGLFLRPGLGWGPVIASIAVTLILAAMMVWYGKRHPELWYGKRPMSDNEWVASCALVDASKQKGVVVKDCYFTGGNHGPE